MRYLKTNTATRITVGPFNGLDGITPATALTVTNEKLTLMVDTGGVPTLVLDAAPTASGGANDMVHVTGDDSGFYDLELAAADVNYLGRAILCLNNVAAHVPVFHEFMIVSANFYDAMFGSSDLAVNATKIEGTDATDQIRDSVVSDATRFAGADIAAIKGYIDTEVAAILAAVDTEVAAIKAKTDSLTFTVAGFVDANVQKVNDVTITGDGSGTPFGV